MYTVDKARQRKRPVFGILSIILPLLGALCGVTQAHFVIGNGEGWAEVSTFIHAFVAGILLGFIAVVCSFLRLENYRFLPVIGFILNAVPAVWLALR